MLCPEQGERPAGKAGEMASRADGGDRGLGAGPGEQPAPRNVRRAATKVFRAKASAAEHAAS